MNTTAASTTPAASTSNPATPAPASAIDQDMVGSALRGVGRGFVPPQTEKFDDTKLPGHLTPMERRMTSLLAYDLYRGLPKVALAWRRRHAMEADVIPQDSGSIRWLLANSLQLKMAEAETRREISRRITNLRLGELVEATQRSASAQERMARAMEGQTYAIEQGVAKAVKVVETVGGSVIEVAQGYGEMAPAIKTAVETLTPMIVAEGPKVAPKLGELIASVTAMGDAFRGVAVAAGLKIPAAVEAPKAEETKAEEPKGEAPKVEAPKAEETKAEEPKGEAPKVEAPKVEAPPAPGGATPPKGLNAKQRREWIRSHENALRGVPAAELHA